MSISDVSSPRRRGSLSGDVKDIRNFIAALAPFDNRTLAERRTSYNRAKRLFPVPSDVMVETVAAGGVPAERLTAPGSAAGPLVLYFHGGSYVMGSLDSHRHLAAAVAEAVPATVVLLDYRLAPEHPFPAALEDALAAYRSMVEGGQPPGRIVIAGDSAGGGLAVATMIAARDEGLPLPAAAALIAPWVDLSCTVAMCAAFDPLVNPDRAREAAGFYLAGRDPRTPFASPLYGDLRGLPPLLIQAASEEVLLGDAHALDRCAREQGVSSTLELTPDVVHVWHWFAPILREGREAIARMGDFIRTATADPAHHRSPRSSGRAARDAAHRTALDDFPAGGSA
jgi:monoterpene epsilon-lactone hydrolase